MQDLLAPLSSVEGMLRFNTFSLQVIVVTLSSSSGTVREPTIFLSSYIPEKKIFGVIVYRNACSTTDGSPMEK
jgi:hypothetical protein